MTRTKLIIAVLLNLFALPGMGQMHVGRKARGMIFVGLVSCVLLLLTLHIVTSINAQVAELAGKQNQMDMMQLAQSVSAMSQNVIDTNSFALRGYFFLLGVGYIASIADLFWLYYDTPRNA